MTSAEQAYLFRHALMRDAAYELQLPRERAQLHQKAFELIEQAYGGPAPEPGPVTISPSPSYVLHAVDGVAAELADHLRAADAGTSIELRRLYLRRAAEHAERVYQNEDAVRMWRELAGLQAASDRPAVMIRIGSLATLLGRLDEAERAYLAALESARGLSNTELIGAALHHVAVLYRDRGQRELARKTVDEALELHRRTGIARAEASTLGVLASLQQSAHDFAGAKVTLERALEVARQSGNERLEGVLMGNIGLALFEMSEFARAEQSFEESLRACRKHEERLQEGIVLSNLARLYQFTKRAVQGESAFREAIDIHREVGNTRFEGMTLCDLALCRLELARVDEARGAWQQGIAILEEIGDRVTLACLRGDLHEACSGKGIEPFRGAQS